MVREHIDAVRAVAIAAVARPLAAATSRSSSAARTNAPAARRVPSRRRAPEEIAVLAERLYAALHATPGATMTVLARQEGSTPGEFGVAVAWLRRQDRIRTVGERQYATYVPVAQPTAAVEA